MNHAAAPQHALVVEPRRRMRELVTVLLEETGYQVGEAESPDNVIEILEGGTKVSLVFLDLPARQLKEFAGKVSRTWPWVRLIVPYSDEAEAAALPETTLWMKAPWNPLDVLIQAELAQRTLTQ